MGTLLLLLFLQQDLHKPVMSPYCAAPVCRLAGRVCTTNTAASSTGCWCRCTTTVLPFELAWFLYLVRLTSAGKQVVCALQTHQPALQGAGVGAAGTPEAEVPMLRFKVCLKH